MRWQPERPSTKHCIAATGCATSQITCVEPWLIKPSEVTLPEDSGACVTRSTPLDSRGTALHRANNVPLLHSPIRGV